MQALTRNPLADPGLLGVNAGAARPSSSRSRCSGHRVHGYVWFAFAGAAAAAVVVYALGARGAAGAAPVRLALAGTAVTAALLSSSTAITLLDRDAFNQLPVLERRVARRPRRRRWPASSRRSSSSASLLALVLARPLNALALGEDAGRALGAARRAARARWRAVAVTLLCGAATAAAGPIVVRRPHRPARRARARRPRPALGLRLLDACSRRSCCSARTSSAGSSTARGAAGRHRHRVPRRAGVHRARPPPPDRAAVTARRRAARRRPRSSARACAAAAPSSAWRSPLVALGRRVLARDRRLPAPARRGHRGAVRRRRRGARVRRRAAAAAARASTALLVGAALGVAGAIFQSLTRNPLGSPDIIGFTAGAAAGACRQIVVFGGGAAAVAARRGRRRRRDRDRVVYVLAFRPRRPGLPAGARRHRRRARCSRGQRLPAHPRATRRGDGRAGLARGSLNGRGWETCARSRSALVLLLPLRSRSAGGCAARARRRVGDARSASPSSARGRC